MRIYWILAWLLLLPSWLWANELYEVQVVVEDQSDETRSMALPEAFKKMMVKVVGRSSVVENGFVQAESVNAARYVTQQGYVTGEDGRRSLGVVFDQALVEQFLTQQKIAFWTGHRPTLLLWIAIEQAGERRLFHPELDPMLVSAVRELEQARGVSLLLPLMDSQDQEQLNASDVWGGFDDRVVQASARYTADVVLLARMKQLNDSQWQVNWHWLAGEPNNRWQASSINQSALVKQGIERVLSRLLDKFQQPVVPKASLAGSSNVQFVEKDAIQVAVAGVRNGRDYTKVQQFMNALSSAKKVVLVSSSVDKLVFSVTLNQSLGLLKEELVLGSVLVPQAGNGVMEGIDLLYRVGF